MTAHPRARACRPWGAHAVVWCGGLVAALALACNGADAIEPTVQPGSHWIERDYPAVLDKLVRDGGDFAEAAAALGYRPFAMASAAGAPEHLAGEQSEVHERGGYRSFLVLDRLPVPGKEPTLRFRFVFDGMEGTTRNALVQQSQAVIQRLRRHYGDAARHALPSGSPPGLTVDDAPEPLALVWEPAPGWTVSFDPAAHVPRIVVEAYRVAGHPDPRPAPVEPVEPMPVVETPEPRETPDPAASAARFDRDALHVPGFASDARVDPRIRDLHHAFVVAAAAGPEAGGLRTASLDVGRREWAVESADATHIHLRGAGNVVRRVAWRQLDPLAMIAGYRDLADFDAEKARTVARYAYAVGLPEEGDRELKRLLDAGQIRRNALNTLLAQLRGIPEPEGGFAWDRDLAGTSRFLTRDEQAARSLILQVEELVLTLERDPALRNEPRPEVASVAAALLKLGPHAREPALSRFREKWQEAVTWLQRVHLREGVWIYRLYEMLQRIRAEALTAVRRASTYYRDDDGTVVGQEAVDTPMQQIRALWDTPFDLIVQEDPQLQHFVENAQWLAALLDAVGDTESDAPAQTDAAITAVRDRIDQSLRMRDHSPTSLAQHMAQRVRDIREAIEDDASASAEEKAFAIRLNEYRFMLGLEPLRLHDGLMQAARAHSAHMNERGELQHELPDHPHGDTPVERARQFGYSGSLGEILAFGSAGHDAASAFDAWYRSPGHHRNMVDPRWRVVGIGLSRDGRYWTVMFGVQ